MAEVETRNERKRKITNQKLAAAAIQVLLQDGLEASRAEDISDIVDIGRRTFYNYFDSKHDCIREAVRIRFWNHADIAKSTIEAAHKADDSVFRLAQMAKTMFTVIASDEVVTKLIKAPDLLIDAIASSQKEFMLETVMKGVMQGHFKPISEVNALENIVSWGFVGLVFSAIRENSIDRSAIIWAEFLLKTLGVEDDKIKQVLNAI